MPGIYLHIPFCKQACFYCNFHFSTTLKQKEELVDALLQEITFQSPDPTGPVTGGTAILPEEAGGYLGNKAIETVYFGGGTPSLLTVGELRLITDKLLQRFKIDKNAEITLEANPDDITEEKLQGWKQAGINRLSIGVQSFLEEELQWMNRAHNAVQALQCIELARANGFDNISADLIYGTPALSNEDWQRNVARVVALNIPHISCYALTVEANTALDKFIREKKFPPVDPDKAALQFELLSEWLAAAGYEHYEISNFARPGRRSRHNGSYWKGEPYLGLGPSAHSFNGYSRQWNIANNALYIQSIQRGIIPFEIEVLTPVQQLNEYIMISLRTIEGCDVDYIKEKWGEAESERLKAGSGQFIREGKMIFQDHHLKLTRPGQLLADGIAAGLFV